MLFSAIVKHVPLELTLWFNWYISSAVSRVCPQVETLVRAEEVQGSNEEVKIRRISDLTIKCIINFF